MKTGSIPGGRTIAAGLGLLALTGVAWATTARTWVIEGRDAFMAGTLDGASITADGAVSVGPDVEHQFSDADPRLWAATAAADGTAYVAAGEDGKIWQVGTGGAVTEHFALDEGLAQALAMTEDGRLIVGASQPGRLITIAEDGVASETLALEAGYVWDLAQAPDGTRWVATGEPAAVWRVDTDGTIARVYEAPDEHVRRLAWGAAGELYAGTVGQGLVVRIRGPEDVFVVHDTEFAEVTGLGFADGALWVAGNRTSTGSNGGEGTGAGGTLLRIDPEGGAERFWDFGETVHSLTVDSDRVLAGTGEHGRVYEAGRGGMQLLAELPSGQIGELIAAPAGPIAMGSNPAGIYRFARGVRSSATFTSAVRDAGTIAQWGRLQFAASDLDGARVDDGVTVYARSGNTAEPGPSWSDWNGPYAAGAGGVAIPPARFAQLRVELRAGARTPRLRRVALVYVPRNTRPVIESIRAHPAGVVYRENAAFEDGLPFAQLPAVVESRLQDQDPNAAAANGAGGSFRGRPLFVAGRQTVTWEVDDPDGDALRQRLEFRAEGTTQWKPLADDIENDTYVFDTARVRDGRYEVRLVVDDLPDNSATDALEAISDAVGFLVDNTPPEVRDVSVAPAGDDAYRITGVATDASSIVLRVRYSVDGREWRTVLPADGAADSASEAFEFEVAGNVSTVVIQVTDGAMNRGADQVSVE